MNMIVLSLLTVVMVKNSHILAGIYFIFLTKRLRPDLKGFKDQSLTLVKRLGK